MGPLDDARAIALGWASSFDSPVLCGALPTGVVACLSATRQSVPLPQPATALTVSGPTCATWASGVTCWTSSSAPAAVPVPPRSVLTTADRVCGLGDDGLPVCAGLDGRPAEPPWPVPPGPIRAWTGRDPACAISMAGQVKCASGALDAWAAEIGTWTAIATGSYSNQRGTAVDSFAVGIGLDGLVHTAGPGFWGEVGSGKREPGTAVLSALGPAEAVAASSTHACALAHGRVACWGRSREGQVAPSARLELPACEVDTAASLDAYRGSLRSQKAAFEACMGRACGPGETDCHLGCRPPEPESRTVPEWAYVYVQTRDGCEERPQPSGITMEPAPVVFPGVDDAVQLAVADGTTCVLRAAGQVRCWGAPPTFPVDGVPRGP